MLDGPFADRVRLDAPRRPGRQPAEPSQFPDAGERRGNAAPGVLPGDGARHRRLLSRHDALLVEGPADGIEAAVVPRRKRPCGRRRNWYWPVSRCARTRRSSAGRTATPTSAGSVCGGPSGASSAASTGRIPPAPARGSCRRDPPRGGGPPRRRGTRPLLCSLSYQGYPQWMPMMEQFDLFEDLEAPRLPASNPPACCGPPAK